MFSVTGFFQRTVVSNLLKWETRTPLLMLPQGGLAGAPAGHAPMVHNTSGKPVVARPRPVRVPVAPAPTYTGPISFSPAPTYVVPVSYAPAAPVVTYGAVLGWLLFSAFGLVWDLYATSVQDMHQEQSCGAKMMGPV